MNFHASDQSKSERISDATEANFATGNPSREVTAEDLLPHREDDHVVHESIPVCESALDRLPPETLADIFLFYMSTMARFNRTSPFNLGAVCQRWRQVAWTTPRVWSNFELNSRGKDISVTRVQLTEEWLSKAGAHPLSIIFHGRFLNTSGPGLSELYHLIDVFNKYASQWHYLYLDAPSCVVARLDDSSASGLGCLHELDFPSIGGIWPIGILNRVAPRIVRTGYDLLEPLSLNWTFVTHLTASSLNAKALLQMLKLAPCLRECHFEYGGWDIDLTATSDIHIVHPTMELLDIRLSADYPNKSIFHYVTFPALEDLTCRGMLEESFSLKDFVGFLRRCASGLKSLVLEDVDWSGEGLIYIARATPYLESLRISIFDGYEGISEAFYEALASHGPAEDDINSSSTEILLPLLRKFKWEANEGFPWAVLVGFLDPLPQLGNSRRPLNSIEISCYIAPPDDPIPYISKEVLSRLSDFTDEVQFRFRIPARSRDGHVGDGDLWRISVEKNSEAGNGS